MNAPFVLEVLGSVENRKWARYMYLNYHNLIRGAMINKYQWRYLKEQEEREATVDREMYHFLGHLSSDRKYYAYLRYIEQKQIVDDYYAVLPKYLHEEDLSKFTKRAMRIKFIILHNYL